MVKRFVLFGVLVIAALLGPASVTEAALITLGDSGWGMITTPQSGGLVTVQNFYVFNDEVVIELDKNFDTPIKQNGLFDRLVVTFEKLSADAVSRIVIDDEFIHNRTGTEWLDFHMALILIDPDAPQAGFDDSYIPDGDQLEDVYYDNETGYNGLPIELVFNNTSGGGVPVSPPGENVFQPGAAGGSIVIEIDPEMEVGSIFGLKEYPSVPEPATILLLGGGYLMFAVKRKRSV